MSSFLLLDSATIIARIQRRGMVSNRKEPFRCVALRFLSGMAALLLAQIAWLPPTGMALGQGTGNGGTLVATPMNAACGQELQQFCSGVQPGQGRLIQCLAGRSSGDLSSACKTFVAQARKGCAPELNRSVQCIKPWDTDPAIKAT
jgi:hypothetical protein